MTQDQILEIAECIADAVVGCEFADATVRVHDGRPVMLEVDVRKKYKLTGHPGGTHGPRSR